MRQPTPIFWFRLLCVWVGIVNVGLFAWGWYLSRMVMPPDVEITPEQTKLFHFLGLSLMGMGVVFAPLNFWLASIRPNLWYWTVGITNIIAAGFCCPAGWLLLIVWSRPDVKAYCNQPPIQ